MKNKNPAPQLKKVKIDDHIRASKKGNEPVTPRKRGRPRKNSLPSNLTEQTNGSGNSQSSGFEQNPQSAMPHPAPLPASQAFEPVYDTTEEAKGFLRTPFDLAAGLTGEKRLALYPEQLEALAPSFKIVYDKHIKPHLGENPEIWAFAVVASGIVMEKVSIFRQAKREAEEKNRQPNAVNLAGYPSIPQNNNPTVNQ